jgi:probable HAF family extracellular repeat protein
MTRPTHQHPHRLSLTLIAAAALTGAAHGEKPSYSIVDLSTFAGSHIWLDPGSSASAITSGGAVVGHSITPTESRDVHAFRALRGNAVDIGTLPGDSHSMAFAVNPAGDAVGVSFNLGALFPRGVLWPNAGGPIDLGAMEPRDINASGQIAGSIPWTGGIVGAVGTTHACRRMTNGAVVDLGTLGGPSSAGLAINADGWVVGESMLSNGLTTHAVLWPASGSVDLGTLGGSGSRALDLEGLVAVGFADINGNRPHAARWTFTSGGTVATKTDLGTLPGGSTSVAYAVSGESIVGSADDRAVLWKNGTIIDLNSKIDPNELWVLTKASSIDSLGRIVGVGRHKGLTRAFVLTPIIPADVDGDGVVGQTDLAILLGAWGSSDPTFDLDGSGSVDAPDLAILLGAWS